ncbi:MAG: L-2-hydroxyglutarate oxidase [Anaerolineales bacterium]
MYDFAIIGGGIVGLATGMALTARFPNAKFVLLEKEAEVGRHQSGSNSGVIHSGIYYKPGSLKAKYCLQGAHSMVEFCRQNDINHKVCGKIIVATENKELPHLNNLFERGLEHGMALKRLNQDQVKEFEPHVNGLAGLHIPSTGVVNYKQVCKKMAAIIQSAGGHLPLGDDVRSVKPYSGHFALETTLGAFEARYVITCAGLQSDRVARLFNIKLNARIFPFRGEYYELKPEKRFLANGPIYPVPNPASPFSFLGVHFTRMIDDSVHAGPNAVLSLKREGYRKTDFSLPDVLDTITYPGFWELALKHGKSEIAEVARSFSKKIFTASLNKLIPEIQETDLLPSSSGVRAVALLKNGALVDDFLIVHGERSMHVCNAPSPAATASIEIGKAIVAQIPEQG